MADPNLMQKFYPETCAGGYSSVDGTVEFYGRVNALLDPEMTVLDYGAGRGAWYLDDPVDYRKNIRLLKGKVKKVVACDVDPVVRDNPAADECFVIDPDGRLPFDDGAFDLIVSDVTLEHVQNPEHVSAELARVLKPGGWICARTANRYGYVALAASLVPNRKHVSVLKHIQPKRKGIDVFPTAYRMNTARAIRKLFPSDRFDAFIYTVNAEPAYAGNSTLLWRLFLLIHRLTPGWLATSLNLFLRKKPVG
ncbi:MAG: class I SAM-dependent methyltransferase [Leptospirillia bacterium]